jgi:hypothetical protein
VIGRGQLDVHLESLFDFGDRAEHAIDIRNQFDVDADRALTPAVQKGGGPSGQIHTCRVFRLLAQGAHHPMDALGIG